jgi:hypothetical protein
MASIGSSVWPPSWMNEGSEGTGLTFDLTERRTALPNPSIP